MTSSGRAERLLCALLLRRVTAFLMFLLSKVAAQFQPVHLSPAVLFMSYSGSYA